MVKIIHKRGLEASAPTADPSELIFTTDTGKMFYGTGGGNVEVAKKTDLNSTNSTLSSHTTNKSNPHEVTKNQVGLGSVNNYALATIAEAQAGTSAVKYMTPALTKTAIESLTPKTNKAEVDSAAQTTNSAPSVFYAKGLGIYQEIKTGSTVGLADHAYVVLESAVPGTGVANGPVSQKAVFGTSVYYRQSTSTSTWGSWVTIATTAYVDALRTEVEEVLGG